METTRESKYFFRETSNSKIIMGLAFEYFYGIWPFMSIHNTRNITKRMNLFEIQKAFQVCLKVLIFTSWYLFVSFAASELIIISHCIYRPLIFHSTTQMSITGLRHMSRVTCHESPLVWTWRCVVLLRVVACCCGWALPSRWGGCCEMQQWE